MTFSDPLFITSMATGVSLLIVALLTKRFPPKNINDLYGYRTARSKANQEAWDYSQKYSSELMIWVAIANSAFSILGLVWTFPVWIAIGLSMIFMALSFAYLFWETEAELKKRFGE